MRCRKLEHKVCKDLLEQGYITNKQLEEVNEIAKFRVDPLYRILTQLNIVESEVMDSVVEKHLPAAETNLYELEMKVTKTTIRLLKLDGDILPFALNDQSLRILIPSFKDKILEALERKLKLKLKIEPFLIGKEKFLVLQSRINSKNKISFSSSKSVFNSLTKDPYAKLVDDCLRQAKNLGASDIHFEPFPDKLLIRFRVHGVLTDWKHFAPEHTEPLILRAKTISELDLAISNKPQDSRASLKDLNTDIRSNSMPVSSGFEKVVFRMIYQESSPKLSELQLPSSTEIDFLKALRKKNGLILLSGPTGSGKTTTLYAFLNEMDRRGKNISTLENPVEKYLPRINQVNIQKDDDFRTCQRALMRQDPDIVLLGEIRDEQTAQMAFKLASTGHLVLSTIHANGAAEVVDRLQHLSIDPLTIKDNLRLSVAQRLYPLLCQHCSIPPPGFEKSTRTKSDGCDSCTRGIKGRIPLVEYISGEDDILKINPRHSLRDQLLKKIQEGKIDVQEADC